MSVTVEGPDGNNYEFPDGTDKTAAVAYFKKKGITGASAPADEDFTSNTKGEGLYPMSGVLGDIQVPFSKVMDASGAGYRMTQKDRERYGRDETADFTKKLPGLLKTDPEIQRRVLAGKTPREDQPLPEVVPEGPGWWQRVRNTVGDITQTKSEAPGVFNLPAAGEMGLNYVKRVGAGLFGLADMPVQAAQGAREMASGDPILGQQGQGRLLALTPQAQAAGRVQEAWRERSNPKLEATNILGDATTAFLAPKAAEWSLKAARTIPGLPRAAGQMLAGTGPELTRRVAQKEIGRLAHEQTVQTIANAERKKQFLQDIDRAKSADSLKMADHRQAVIEAEEANNQVIAEHQAKNAKKLNDYEDLNTVHQKGQEAIRSRDQLEDYAYDELQKLDKKIGKQVSDEYTNIGKIMADKDPLSLDEAIGAVEEAYGKTRGSREQIPLFEAILKEESPLGWNDMQGYYEELGAQLRSGTLAPGIYKAVESLASFFRNKMDVMAENAGVGERWQQAREAFKKYKETFDAPGSPVAKAVKARNAADAAKPFQGRKVLEQDEAIKNLNTYDPGLTARLRNLRETSQAAAKAPKKAPKQPMLDKPPDLASKAIPRAPEVKPPEFKETPTPDLDIVEAKRKKVRDKAEQLSGLSQGDLYFLIGGPIGFALKGAVFDALFLSGKKLITSHLDAPKVVDWLSRPTPKDLALLEQLPPEIKANAKAKLREFIADQQAKGGRLKIAGSVAAWLGMTGAGSEAEERARESARRLQTTP